MIRMPTCAARRVLAAFAVVLSMGCGTTVDDVFIPEDSGKDTTTKDVTTDTAIVDAAKDTSIPDTSVGDTSVSDASDGAIADADPDADDGSAIDGGAPDASVLCGQAQGFGYASSDGGCGTGESYACSADKYELLCECPAQTCTCKKNGVQVSAIKFAGCPGCKQPNFASVASGCGVPY